jgi:predicted esterase YcpF (UPF0227 family)
MGADALSDVSPARATMPGIEKDLTVGSSLGGWWTTSSSHAG